MARDRHISVEFTLQSLAARLAVVERLLGLPVATTVDEPPRPISGFLERFYAVDGPDGAGGDLDSDALEAP